MTDEFELVDPKSARAGSKKFTQQQSALRYLKEAAQDPKNVDHLNDIWRTKVNKGRSSGPVPHMRTILNDLSNLLVDGDLRIARKKHGGGGGGGGASKRKPSAAPKQYRSYSLRNSKDELFIRPREEFVPAPPKPTPNIAQQVATLKTAAKQGAAFCEVCQDPPASSE